MITQAPSAPVVRKKVFVKIGRPGKYWEDSSLLSYCLPTFLRRFLSLAAQMVIECLRPPSSLLSAWSRSGLC